MIRVTPNCLLSQTRDTHMQYLSSYTVNRALQRCISSSRYYTPDMIVAACGAYCHSNEHDDRVKILPQQSDKVQQEYEAVKNLLPLVKVLPQMEQE